jgi:hypothetical protein
MRVDKKKEQQVTNELLSDCAPAALLVAYVVTGFIFAAMYVPKLRCMIRDPQSTATAYSPSTEWLWTACRVVSLLYVGLVARDAAIAVVILLDLTGRVASLIIVLRARRVVARTNATLIAAGVAC